MERCRLWELGRVPYRVAWDVQRRIHADVADGHAPPTLLLLEHDHVYTVGRRGSVADVLADANTLQRLGAKVVEVDRGGQVTYHGPGQLLAYPIIPVRSRGPLWFVRTLEQTIIDTLGDFGVAAERIEGLTGVWCGGEKVAAIGVKISRGVAYHGIALNVDPDLSYYRHIVPCGIPDRGVTSIARLTGRPVTVEQAAYSFAYRFSRNFDYQVVPEDPPEGLLAGVPTGAADVHPA